MVGVSPRQVTVRESASASAKKASIKHAFADYNAVADMQACLAADPAAFVLADGTLLTVVKSLGKDGARVQPRNPRV